MEKMLYDVTGVLKAGSIFQEAMGSRREQELADYKLAQDKAYKDEALAMQKDQAAREKDKYNRDLLKETTTSEAMQATLDPSKYTQGKVFGEQQAAEAGIANLSPEEQVIARQQMAANYDPKLSGQQWLTGATSATNVDQGKLFDTKTKMYDIAASTPGTPEFQAKYDAEIKAAKDKNAITVGGQLSVLNAQKKWADEKEQKELDKQKSLAQFTNDLANQNKTFNMFKQDPNTSAVTQISVPKGDIDKYSGQGFTLGAITTGPKTEAQLLNESKIKIAEKAYEDKKEKDKIIATADSAAKNDILDVVSQTDSASELAVEIEKLNKSGMSYSDIKKLVGANLNLKDPSKSKSITDIGLVNAGNLVDTLREANAKLAPSTSTKVLQVPTNTSDSKVLTESVTSDEPFSLFGVQAPTSYNPILATSPTKDVSASSDEATYYKLPEYIRRDISLSKYLDNPNFYKRQFLGY